MISIIETYDVPLLMLNLETNKPFLAYSMILKDDVRYYANYWHNDEASVSNSEMMCIEELKIMLSNKVIC